MSGMALVTVSGARKAPESSTDAPIQTLEEE
jgi:hypothetical protein